MWGFAIKTLLADRRKLLLALLGVVFALVLVNVQGGMFLGMIRKSTLLVDHSHADIWVGHRGVQNADITADIPVAWESRIRGLGVVQRVEPCLVGGGMMALPDGTFEGVLVVGSPPGSQLSGPWALAAGSAQALDMANGITIDRLDQARLGHLGLSDLAEINGRRARVVAITDGIVGFITTPYIFTTLDRAQSYSGIAPGRCSYLLVRLHAGEDIAAAVAAIRQRLPHADVHSTADFSRITRRYWIARTGLGLSFGSSTLLGLAVGLVVVAQSLYAFVLDHLENFAALKAIGATDRQIGSILVGQGMAIAGAGCLLGNLASGLLWFAISSPRLTIVFTPLLMAIASLLAIAICIVSALLPLARIRRIDPVIVLQG